MNLIRCVIISDNSNLTQPPIYYRRTLSHLIHDLFGYSETKCAWKLSLVGLGILNICFLQLTCSYSAAKMPLRILLNVLFKLTFLKCTWNSLERVVKNVHHSSQILTEIKRIFKGRYFLTAWANGSVNLTDLRSEVS